MIFTVFKRVFSLGTALVLSMLLAGCFSNPNPQNKYTFPFSAPATPTAGNANTPSVVNAVNANAPSAATPAVDGQYARLRVGDLIIVTFSDQLNPPPRQEMNIPDSGVITLPFDVHVPAAGKTTSELERDIRDKYVPAMFVNLTVTVRTDQRVFFVDGEVKTPGRQPYTGIMTVLRAITTAGGFTDYAKRKKIELRRHGGERFFINHKEALKNPALDLPVYPNDYIFVDRSVW
jgi:protein involved in polysaccharide export with SLBB domain